MNLLKNTFLTSLIIISFSCQSKVSKVSKEIAIESIPEKVVLNAQQLEGYETAYFASGCFWCVESVFESLKGVKEAVSGYSGGTEENPTYEQVVRGTTGHAEAVKVYYDPKVVSFQKLVQVFFGSQDPTTLNQQGPDRGTQYRSIAFYKNDKEKQVIEEYLALLESENVYDRPIVTEVVMFTSFYDAEEYHQDYERKHPNNSYIRAVSIPRLNRFKENFPSFLKEEDVH